MTRNSALLVLLETHCSRHHGCIVLHTFLLHNLGLGSSLPETSFTTKIGGVWPRETAENLGPLAISAMYRWVIIFL